MHCYECVSVSVLYPNIDDFLLGISAQNTINILKYGYRDHVILLFLIKKIQYRKKKIKSVTHKNSCSFVCFFGVFFCQAKVGSVKV